MASLLSLSTELQLSIVEHFHGTSPEILHLSRTCRQLRAITAPLLFQSIILSNTSKSGASVSLLADSAYKKSVRSLHYKGCVPMPYFGAWGMDEDGPDDLDVYKLPTDVKDVLSSLHRFPNLRNVIVQFPLEQEEIPGGNLEYFDNPESFEDVLEAEEKEGWRAFMRESFDAVAANIDASNIKVLELRGLFAKEVSSWRSGNWKRLLGSLEEFTFDILGIDNGVSSINVAFGYTDFYPLLSSFFFDHLSNATKFSFQGNEDGVPGLSGLLHAYFPFTWTQMPRLQVLQLQYYFIGPSLRNFLTSHAGSLKSVKLEDCYSGSQCYLAQDPITWAELFTAITSSNPTLLTNFQVLPACPPLTSQEIYGGADEPDAVPDDVKRVRHIMELEEGRKVFAYATVDDKYGMLFQHEQLNVEAFLAGEDQRAWNELLGIMERNRNG